ncbi:hypothetical protein PR001_g30107, partial [Phytophthora rubi]
LVWYSGGEVDVRVRAKDAKLRLQGCSGGEVDVRVRAKDAKLRLQGCSGGEVDVRVRAKDAKLRLQGCSGGEVDVRVRAKDAKLRLQAYQHLTSKISKSKSNFDHMKCVYLLDSLCAELIITPTATPVPTIVVGSQSRLRLRPPPLEARLQPLDTDAGADCDSGGYPWQLDGDVGPSHAGDADCDWNQHMPLF